MDHFLHGGASTEKGLGALPSVTAMKVQSYEEWAMSCGIARKPKCLMPLASPTGESR